MLDLWQTMQKQVQVINMLERLSFQSNIVVVGHLCAHYKDREKYAEKIMGLPVINLPARLSFMS